MNQHSIILSLGTNSYDGMNILCQAEDILKSWIRLDSCTRKLKNPAIGMGKEANDFHNMLIKTRTSLSLHDMMLLAKKLETLMGNSHQLRDEGIVMMDMDIIKWDDKILKPKDTERKYYKILIEEL